jgi:hypothetical protein
MSALRLAEQFLRSEGAATLTQQTGS